jgi:hypothetical protein
MVDFDEIQIYNKVSDYLSSINVVLGVIVGKYPNLRIEFIGKNPPNNNTNLILIYNYGITIDNNGLIIGEGYHFEAINDKLLIDNIELESGKELADSSIYWTNKLNNKNSNFIKKK